MSSTAAEPTLAELLAELRQIRELVEKTLAAGRQEYLTIQEAAEVAGLSAKTIRNAAYRGELVAGGKPIRIRRSDLDAWLARGRPAVTADLARAKANPHGLS
jgi:excisionase family DNA binding protein